MRMKVKKRGKRSDLHDTIVAVDQRKASMGRPKLLADIQRELASKSKEGTASQREKRRLKLNSPKNDIMKRGRRLPGSGWSGPNQK
jgi:hypothetical protein